ncbi:proteasome subunit beta type-2-like [Cydia pomonella]|uniref:proteasome subunit beta type-2-like n=1 Tax=Cydia pomonella TaxID=82600 RepID=UPI002ADE370D|nr:proteasome subunit beta type-2-like [Cydia pomonella]
MELQCILGLKCNDFAMIAADQMIINSIIVMTDEHEKIFKIDDKMIMAVVGEHGETQQFVHYLMRNMHLYQIRNNYSLDIGAVAHFARRNLADAMRRSRSYNGAILAGYDDKEGGQLYFLEGLGVSQQMPFAAIGLAGMLSVGVLCRYHKPNLTEAEAYEVLKLSTQEIQQRFIVQLPKFQVSLVSKDGVKQLPTLQHGS